MFQADAFQSNAFQNNTFETSSYQPCDINLDNYFTGATSYSILSGSLPDGLSLVGNRILGTPTRVQTTQFVIRASNSIDLLDSATITFNTGLWALRFDGVDEYVTVSNCLSDTALHANQTVADSFSYVAYLRYIHRETRTDWRMIIRFGGTALYTFNNQFARQGSYLTTPFPLVVGQTYIIRLVLDAGVNGIKHGSFAISASNNGGLTYQTVAALQSLPGVAGINRLFGDAAGECSLHELLGLRVFNKAETVLLRDYDASASGGVGNLLIDRVSNQNGTQAGTWPADDSEWVSYAPAGGSSGILKIFLDSAWVVKPMKYFDGASWITKSLKKV